MKRLASPIFFLAFFLMAGNAKALPPPKGYVNDFAGVIDDQIEEKLNALLSNFEARSGNELAVVTVKSLDGRPIEDYAVDLYKNWGIGKKGKDNGVLVLVAPSERKTRIEVGYGLEGIINDALAGRIIREKMIPVFKEGNYNAGIWAGTQTVLEIIARKEGIEFNSDSLETETTLTTKKSPFHTLSSILLLIILAYMFIRHPWLFLLFLSGTGGGGGRRGGFGGFGGFGGGLSGGGGASGRW